MSIEGQITQHLLAELFIKTGYLLKEEAPLRRAEILQVHGEFQRGIENLRSLLLACPKSANVRAVENG